MMIEIQSPELEKLIRERTKSGADLEDVIMQALKSSAAGGEPASVEPLERPAGRKSLAQLFAESPFKGLEIDFERDSDLGRDIAL